MNQGGKMSGYTINQYQNDMRNVNRDFTKYINELTSVLPREYDLESIHCLLKEYYPFEYRTLKEKFEYYSTKDKSLRSKGKKSRFNMNKPMIILANLKVTKKVLSPEWKKEYKSNFCEDVYKKNVNDLHFRRDLKNSKVKDKIDKAKAKTQEMEPFYIDELMGLYDRKTTTQRDKVYIFKELEKYYCPKVIKFFKKKVDTEYNRQLREMAYYHLQSLKHFVPPLRKQKYMRIPSKNKERRKYLKEVYANEKFSISELPDELEYRIENSKEQKMKEFDFFISHSSSDFNEVQIMIKALNKNSMNVYCDWINDTDYLKRNLVRKATVKVIEKRLEQSKNILFIKSDNSIKSNWVSYELSFFNKYHKPIYEIDKQDIVDGLFNYKLFESYSLINDDYKSIMLY